MSIDKTCSQSSHLPSYLVASFAKRLARLLLTAPPQAILASIPLLYNLIRRHPTLAVLVHRGDASKVTLDNGLDPFDDTATDPADSKALSSSLWEIASLERHAHHAVANLAKLFRDRLDKPEFPLDPFLEHTASSLIRTELGKRVKAAVPMAFEFSGPLFGEGWEEWEV
jgi:U3 small nucleolar RNA-associated protein 19